MRRLAATLRLVAVAIVLSAPLLPSIDRADESLAIMHVVDTSPSIGAAGLLDVEVAVRSAFIAAGERDHTSAGLIEVGATPDIRVPVGGVLPLEPLFAPRAVPGSDLGAAMRLAGAALPDSGGRRIVLYSDARETRGDVAVEVARLRARGITVDVVPTGAAVPDALTIGEVNAVSPRVLEGEPLEVVTEVRGAPGGQAMVRWGLDGAVSQTEWVTVGPEGRSEVRFFHPRAASGVHVVTASLNGETGKNGGEFSPPAGAVVLVGGKARVLVLGLPGEVPRMLTSALEAADASVEVASLDETELTAARLSAYELVVLADVPVAREGEVTLLAGLTTDSQHELMRYVRERGGGLLVTGGAFGFGPEYASAPIARMLPVEVEDRGDVEDPPVALAIMLDRSGSMGAMVGAHTKLQLAIEAALASASTVRPTDRVAIASVDTVTTWHAPLSPAAELLERREQIRSMALGGGGIYVYTAMVDAFGALTSAAEPVRHVILFSDTADSEEKWQGCPFSPCAATLPYAVDFARTGAAAGITTSVVGIGGSTDPDVPFLRDLATAGGGRFYLSERGTELRRIFVAETRAMSRANHQEGAFAVHPASAHSALSGVDLAAAPEIWGYAQTERRPTADTALVTPDGRPILATWRYGLGQVAALTTDVGGRWTAPWAEWEGAGQLFRQLGRHTMRRRAVSGADARVAVRDRSVELTLELPEGAVDAVPTSVEAYALGSDGEESSIDVDLTRVAPGLYRGRGRSSGEPFVLVRVRDERGQLLAEAAGQSDAGREYGALGPDMLKLEAVSRLGGGMSAPTPSDTLRGAELRPGLVALWPFALLLGALLVVLDLFIRRLGRPVRAGDPRGAAGEASTAVETAPSEVAPV